MVPQIASFKYYDIQSISVTGFLRFVWICQAFNSDKMIWLQNFINFKLIYFSFNSLVWYRSKLWIWTHIDAEFEVIHRKQILKTDSWVSQNKTLGSYYTYPHHEHLFCVSPLPIFLKTPLNLKKIFLLIYYAFRFPHYPYTRSCCFDVIQLGPEDQIFDLVLWVC